MRMFVVNLDRDREKLAAVDGRLKRLDIAFERFPAVEGKSLCASERHERLNSFRVWCSIGRRLQDGELGCALSHLGIYRKMIVDNIRMACVLEDDAICDDRLPEQLRRVEEFLTRASPSVVLLSDRRHSTIYDWCIRPADDDWGTFAYALNLAAARALLKANYPVQRPCDHWHVWKSRGLIELYHAFPTVCDYDHAGESQTATRNKVADFSWPHKLIHKSLRLVGRTLDRILPL